MFQQHALSRTSRTFVSILVALILISGNASGADWADLEDQMARKIAATTGPGAVALNVSNTMSLPKSQVDAIRGSLVNRLAGMGVQVVKPDQAATTIGLELSQNLQEYVWVAEVVQGNTPSSFLFVTMSRPRAPMPGPRTSGLTISRTLLWSQERQILDAAVVEVMGAPTYLLVLDAASVQVARYDSGQWKREQMLSVEPQRAWPRDLRGRIFLRKDHLFDAYLPGIVCSSTGGVTLALGCRESDDAWPLATDSAPLGAFFSRNRNFFTGVLVPGVRQENTVAPFYTAVPLPKVNYTLWAFASVDGTVQVVDGVSKQTLTGLGWGSDIAAIRSSCGSGWQILATSSEVGQPDTVRAFELPDREPIAVGQALSFAGPVTAMWSETNAANAVAVTQNPDSGRYEAYRLSVACGQ